MSDYHGHMTMADGTHVELSPDDAKALMEAAQRAEAEREADMPTTDDALRAMQRAWDRMHSLGWRPAIFCPKDGSKFAVVQYGSTGIFEARYCGDWPSGHIYCCDGVDHPHGFLFKPTADLTDAERERLDACMESERASRDRMISNMVVSDEESN